jgi:hypothetical protein
MEVAGPVDHVGAEADVTHELDAARDADVDAPRLHQRIHDVVGLLARAALGVDGGPRGAVVVAHREPGVARHVVGLLPRLRHAAAEDLLDVSRIDARLRDQTRLHAPEKLGGVKAGEVAATHLSASDGRSQRLDDDRFPHAIVSSIPFGFRFARSQSIFPRIIPLVGTPTPPVTST